MEELDNKTTGGLAPFKDLASADWNQAAAEILNIYRAFGVMPSAADLDQLGKGISNYVAGGNFYTDSGAADAYVLSVVGSRQPNTLYQNGSLYMFLPDNDNTGASTANVSGLGAKNIKMPDGGDPPAGFIKTGILCLLRYDGTDLILEKHALTGGTKRTVITASDASWSWTPGVKSAQITAIGAGGGGGGVNGQGVGTSAAGHGGGGGGACIKEIQDPINTEGNLNITIGSGGAGAISSATGTAGTATTVVGSVVNMSAGGGAGGQGHIGVSGSTAGSDGTLGGTSSGGDINLKGTVANGRTVISGSIGQKSTSGFCPLIGGGIYPNHEADGSNATIAGEGGGSMTSSGITDNENGGDGFRGEVWILERF